jgi:hypothetical protein
MQLIRSVEEVGSVLNTAQHFSLLPAMHPVSSSFIAAHYLDEKDKTLLLQ